MDRNNNPPQQQQQGQPKTAAQAAPTTPTPTGPPKFAYVPTPQAQRKQQQQQPKELSPPRKKPAATAKIEEQASAAGGAYMPLLRVQYKRELENAATVPLPPKVIGGLRDQMERVKICSCKKSNCLKLYCECFACGIHCNAYCNCNSCRNDGAAQNQSVRNKAIIATLEKNPHAFRPRADGGHQTPGTAASFSTAVSTSYYANANNNPPKSSSTSANKTTGCQCKKTRCLKKYCECFSTTTYCTSRCRCEDCRNIEGNGDRDYLIRVERQWAAQRAQKRQQQQQQGIPQTTAEGGTIQKAASSSSIPPDRAPIAAAAASTTAAGEDSNAPTESESLPVVPDFLLPSSCTTPMMLKNGKPCAALAFGQAGTAKTSDGGNSMSGVVEERGAGGLARKAQDESNKKSKSQIEKQKELEEKWYIETQDVMGTFEAMKHELLERKRDAGLIEGDLALSLSREYSYYDLVGSALLASVELDLADVMGSLKEAEQRARHMLAVEKQEQSAKGSPNSMDISDKQQRAPSPVEASLLCTEEDGEGNEGVSRRPAKSPRLDDDPEREAAIIQAAQDAALMRELARIIRRRALEMSEARLSTNSMPL